MIVARALASLTPLGLGVVIVLLLSGRVDVPEATFLPGAMGVSSGFTVLALLILRAQPANRIAWLFLICGVGIAASMGLIYGGEWLVQKDVPGAVPVLLLGIALGQVGWLLLWLVPHFFPDGHPAPGRFWSIVAWTAVAVCGLGFVNIAADLRGLESFTGELIAGTPLARQELNWFRLDSGDWFSVIGQLFLVGGGGASQLWRWWRADRGQRRQITAFALAMTATILLALITLRFFTALPWWITSVLVGLAFTSLPIALGVSILRYRLYEIDRLVSRALSYAVLTALLVGLYVAAVTIATRALPLSSTTAIVLATLACAAAFQPLRRRLQDAVDRRFNPIRARGEQELDAYTSRLRSELTPEDVAADLLAVVGRTVEPRSAAVWLPPR